jgi:hypothetical protein
MRRQALTGQVVGGSGPGSRAGASSPQAETFYQRILEALIGGRVPFLVGGGYAMAHYTGIERPTKDLDVFVTRDTLGRALDAIEAAGYRTQLTYPHFLAKAFDDAGFVDVIFSSGNAACPVDVGWFVGAPRARILGVTVSLCPIEETIWSKAYVMERERYDGHDIAHLIRSSAGTIEWPRLIARFGDNWRVLLAHVILFGFIYPGDQNSIPAWLVDSLVARLHDASLPSASMLCRGTLLSRSQYLDDIDRLGLIDGRTTPERRMSASEIARWTKAIDQGDPPADPRSARRERLLHAGGRR